MASYNPPVKPALYTIDYTAAPQTNAYSGVNNLQAGNAYARVTNLNELRLAVENLRLTVEAMMEELQT